MDYEEYIRCMDSDSDDDNLDTGLILRLIKHMSYFIEGEDGWVIVLPRFKPYKREIEPVRRPEPGYNRVYGANWDRHDDVTGTMKDVMMKISETAKEARRNPPTQQPSTSQQPREEESNEGTHNHNSKKSKRKKKKKKKSSAGDGNTGAMHMMHGHTSREMPTCSSTRKNDE